MQDQEALSGQVDGEPHAQAPLSPSRLRPCQEGDAVRVQAAGDPGAALMTKSLVIGWGRLWLLLGPRWVPGWPALAAAAPCCQSATKNQQSHVSLLRHMPVGLPPGQGSQQQQQAGLWPAMGPCTRACLVRRPGGAVKLLEHCGPEPAGGEGVPGGGGHPQPPAPSPHIVLLSWGAAQPGQQPLLQPANGASHRSLPDMLPQCHMSCVAICGGRGCADCRWSTRCYKRVV